MHAESITTDTRANLDFALQSTLNHVAIIMDGNRRWARNRGLPTAAGHRAGLRSLEKLLPEVRDAGVRHLTLFAFAAANWQRPKAEVQHLMQLAVTALARLAPECLKNRVRLHVIGRRDRLGPKLTAAIKSAELKTAQPGARATLNIALDYSSRHAMTEAAIAAVRAAPQASAAQLVAATTQELASASAGGNVDLLIRTGSERRLSDFMLWECAFAELHFADVLWPDFSATHLRAALSWFATRNRRFGA